MPGGPMDRAFSIRVGCAATILMALAMPSYAQSQGQCPAVTEPVRLDIKPQPGGERIDHSRSKKAIQDLVNRAKTKGQFVAGVQNPDGGQYVWSSIGVTNASFVVSSTAETMVSRTPSGVCGHFTAVTLVIGFQEQVIYIPRDYPEGSCQYQAVLDHERQHVAINRRTVAEYLPGLQGQAQQVLDRAGSSFASSQSGLERKMNDRLGTLIEPLLVPMQQTQRQRNQTLDSAENYRSIQALCSDW